MKRSITIPVIPEGEDQTSFGRHNRMIQAEMKKSRPNFTVLRELVSRSYAMRRIDLLENTYSLTEVFNKYPFLAESDHVSYLLWVYLHNNYFHPVFLYPPLA